MDKRAIAMGVAFSIMWSSAFATARILMAGAPPFLTLTARFAISGLIAVLIARALGTPHGGMGHRWLASGAKKGLTYMPATSFSWMAGL